ncbi:hypothetical protein [Rickettsia endosymbiont of Gonocerus acuteangulatus]|uniref:hypothetical protein n=1 Tax=Rickettsia endosymbiont of Gonocerus acuteangulatus TaxID=3066266 RepID=UPI0031334976
MIKAEIGVLFYGVIPAKAGIQHKAREIEFYNFKGLMFLCLFFLDSCDQRNDNKSFFQAMGLTSTQPIYP